MSSPGLGQVPGVLGWEEAVQLVNTELGTREEVMSRELRKLPFPPPAGSERPWLFSAPRGHVEQWKSQPGSVSDLPPAV